MEETRNALVRMQEFDVSTLARETDLGQLLNFNEAVEPATRLINQYKRLSVAALEDFPVNVLQAIRAPANNDYNLLKQILDFNPRQGNPEGTRQNIIQSLINTFSQTFNTLHPYISYSLHRAADFQRLDREARATIQGIQDKAEEMTRDLNTAREEANNILEEVRRASAEQGVAQQAIYFRDASQDHAAQAMQWKWATIWVAAGLGVYAVATLFLHKLPFLKPETAYEAIQLAVSKVLVFAVISFMLYLSAKNFLSHTHNAIVNRHRQNALMTYKALVDAAGNTPNREVILNHAAACIFGPQSTGYTGEAGPPAPSAKSIVEFLSKPLADGH